MIGQQKRLDISSFVLGQRRDGALRDDALLSLRNLVNYDIIYDTGRLKVRHGYERWNSVELPAVCTQLYQFVDLLGNEHFLGILDTSETEGGFGFDQWYVIKENADHVVLQADGATARRPVITYGNRCFFATNSALRWTDHDTIIGGSQKSFETGITKPQHSPTIEIGASEGNTVGVGAAIPGGLELNATSRKKFAAKFSLASAITLWGIPIRWTPFWSTAGSGAFRISLHVDDSGEPGDRADGDAISPWLAICSGADGVAQENFMTFGDGIGLEGATDYWLVVEASDEYMGNYRGVLPYFLATFGYSATVAADAADYNGTAWIASGKKLGFAIGGVADDDDTYYDYVVTHYASSYNVESRPSDRSDRVNRTSWNYNRFVVTFTQPSAHPQIDKVRIYRRAVGTDPSVADADVTNEYKLVATVDEEAVSYSDIVPTESLEAVLQTEDHYKLADTLEGDDSLRPSAVIPNVLAEWNGRIWLAEEDSNVLLFSKVLEEDGATGLVGDNIPDFYPLENRLEMPVPSGIIGLGVLPGNILAVYFQDESIWIVEGGDQPLNPPPDLSYRELLPNNGLFAVGTLGKVAGGSVFLAREGLYRLSLLGTELLSETNQTILDDIENSYLQDSILTVNGNEIWLLLDTDNDGEREKILILDLQRDLPTRQVRDRAWRTYQYDVSLNDILVRKQGDTYRGVMAADAENKYILELNTGYLDNLFPIPVEGETHDLEVPGLVGVTGVSIRANYIDVVSSYDITITDGVDEPHRFSIMPSAQDDLRGHRAGVRIMRPNFVRVKWESSHVRRDEVRGITIDYILEDLET